MYTTHRSTRRAHARHGSHDGQPTRSAAKERGLSRLEIVIIAICVAALIAVFVSSLGGRATVDVPTAPVRVSQAQTLWDLAIAHPIEGLTTAETVEHIKSINQLESSSVSAGELLLVPAPNTVHTAVASR